MTKNKLIVILIIWQLIFTSCIKGREDLIQDGPTLIINVNWEDNSVIQFNDLVDSVHYIPLKKTDPYIGDITKLMILGEKFIIWDGRGKRVWIFDSQGNYLTDIYSLGNGPGEYLDMSDVFVASDGTVKIGDPTRNIILSYGLDGEYISSEHLEDYLPSYYYSKGDYQYIFSAYMPEKINGAYHLNILKNGKFKYGYFPYDEIWRYSNDGFTAFKDKTLFYRTFDSDIYEVNEEKVSVFAEVQFDPKFESILRTEKDESSEYESFLKDNEFAGMVGDIFFTNSHMSFSYTVYKNGSNYVKSCFYDLENNKLYDFNAIGGAEHISYTPKAASNEWFFTSKDSYEFSNESLNFLSQQAGEEFTDMSNPVIIKFKVK